MRFPYTRILRFFGKYRLASFTNIFLNWVKFVIFIFGWIIPDHESTVLFGLLSGNDSIPVVAMLGRV